MNNKVKVVMGIIVGFAAGATATWQYLSRKYNKIILEEVQAIREPMLEKKVIDVSEEDCSPKEEVISVLVEKDKTKYIDRIKKTSYDKKFSSPVSESKSQIESKEETVKEVKELKELQGLETMLKSKYDVKVSSPIVIPPQEYGEESDYEKISLTYYSDRILADEDDNRIVDVEGCVGEKSLLTFGEYEDDSVFVRNDPQKTYYEILLDQRRYADVLLKKPHKRDS